MGKNKWFNEMDGNPNPAFRASEQNGSTRQKKSSSLPGLFMGNTQEDISFSTYWRASVKRFRRKWLSLKFRSRQVSGATFQRWTLVKFGFIALAAYFIFGRNAETGSFLGGARSNINWNTETKLGVAEEKKKPVAVKKVKKAPKSEAAPVSSAHLHSNQTMAYIQKFSGIAREEMAKYGVPASISLAQGLIESRAGSSKLAVNNNNHFGMKCFSRNCRKGHCTNFTDDTHKDFFLKFPSAQQSWRAHSKLLASGRYAKLKKYGRDYRRWAQGLKSVGYATDRTYAQKLIGIIERYDLHKYDR
jgi:flagellum-specific peptidoglycan hydrolase FlgJ